MRLLEREHHVEKTCEHFTLYALGDIHIGNRHCAMDHLKRDIAEIAADPSALVILMGDIVDCIASSDKRFDPQEVHEAFRNWNSFDNLPQAEVMWAVDALKPIQDKIICILEGNHEAKVTDYTHRLGVKYDPHYELCSHLKSPSLGYCGFVRLRLREEETLHHCYVVTIFAHHGYGAGRAMGGHALALDNALDAVEADLFLFGHRHQSMALSKVRLRLPPRGKLRLEQKLMKACHTGTYLRTAREGKPGYGARALYKPTAIGCRRIRIRPRPLDGSGARDIEVVV